MAEESTYPDNVRKALKMVANRTLDSALQGTLKRIIVALGTGGEGGFPGAENGLSVNGAGKVELGGPIADSKSLLVGALNKSFLRLLAPGGGFGGAAGIGASYESAYTDISFTNKSMILRKSNSDFFDQNIAFTFEDDHMVVGDNINQKGLEEAGDYSANKTDFSYITKKFVEDNFLKNGDYVNPITIGDFAQNKGGLSIQPDACTLLQGSVTGRYGYFQVDNYNALNPANRVVTMGVADTGVLKRSISFGNETEKSMVVTDDVQFKGLGDAADYSATKSALSYATKQMLDAKGNVTATSISAPSATLDGDVSFQLNDTVIIYADATDNTVNITINGSTIPANKRLLIIRTDVNASNQVYLTVPGKTYEIVGQGGYRALVNKTLGAGDWWTSAQSSSNAGSGLSLNSVSGNVQLGGTLTESASVGDDVGSVNLSLYPGDNGQAFLTTTGPLEEGSEVVVYAGLGLTKNSMFFRRAKDDDAQELLINDTRIMFTDAVNQRGAGDALDYSATKQDLDYSTLKMLNDKAASGEYTPTFTQSTGADPDNTITHKKAYFTRIGNIVTVFGKVSFTPMTSDVSAGFTMTLPIASAVVGGDVVGLTQTPDASSLWTSVPEIQSGVNGVNGVVWLTFMTNSNSAERDISYSYTYIIK